MKRRGDGEFSDALRAFSFGVLLCALFSCTNGLSTAIHGDADVAKGTGIDEIVLSATMGLLGPSGTMAMWQLPPEGPVRKVLIVFTATGCGPGQFWDASPNCPRGICSGLPEGRRIVLDALSLGYAVFIPTPMGFDWTTYTWPPDSQDVNNFVQILSEWKHMHGLEGVPNVGLGMSAGGYAVSAVALLGLFESISIMISAGNPGLWGNVPENFPPTFFIHMPKDETTENDVKNFMDILRSKGAKTGDASWTQHPVTLDWFSERTPGVEFHLSARVVSALKEAGFINDDDFMIDNSSNIDWTAPLRSKNVLPEDPNVNGKLMFEESIGQEMNVAYARHVTVSRRNPEMFAWFEGAYEHQTLHEPLATS